MRKVLCLMLFATVWWSDAFASKQFFSSSPEQELAFVIAIVLLVTLPTTFSVVAHRTGKTLWRIIAALFTIPLALAAVLLISYGALVAAIPILLTMANTFLITNRSTDKSVL